MHVIYGFFSSSYASSIHTLTLTLTRTHARTVQLRGGASTQNETPQPQPASNTWTQLPKPVVQRLALLLANDGQINAADAQLILNNQDQILLFIQNDLPDLLGAGNNADYLNKLKSKVTLRIAALGTSYGPEDGNHGVATDCYHDPSGQNCDFANVRMNCPDPDAIVRYTLNTHPDGTVEQIPQTCADVALSYGHILDPTAAPAPDATYDQRHEEWLKEDRKRRRGDPDDTIFGSFGPVLVDAGTGVRKDITNIGEGAVNIGKGIYHGDVEQISTGAGQIGHATVVLFFFPAAVFSELTGMKSFDYVGNYKLITSGDVLKNMTDAERLKNVAIKVAMKFFIPIKTGKITSAADVQGFLAPKAKAIGYSVLKSWAQTGAKTAYKNYFHANPDDAKEYLEDKGELNEEEIAIPAQDVGWQLMRNMVVDAESGTVIDDDTGEPISDEEKEMLERYLAIYAYYEEQGYHAIWPDPDTLQPGDYAGPSWKKDDTVWTKEKMQQETASAGQATQYQEDPNAKPWDMTTGEWEAQKTGKHEKMPDCFELEYKYTGNEWVPGSDNIYSQGKAWCMLQKTPVSGSNYKDAGWSDQDIAQLQADAHKAKHYMDQWKIDNPTQEEALARNSGMASHETVAVADPSKPTIQELMFNQGFG